MPKDHERLLQADADVDPPDRRLVEIGVALHRPDDVADPGQRQLQLPEQLTDRCVRRQPRDDVGGLLAEAGGGPARLDEGAGRIGAAGDGLDLADPVGPLQRRSGRRRVRRRLRWRARPRQGSGGVHGILERGDRAQRRGGRVVQLVREAGGQRAERGQLLALAEGRLHLPQPRDGGANDGERDVRAGGQQLAQRVDGDPQHLGVARGRHGREATPALERGDLSLERARADDGERDAAVAGLARHLQLAVEHDEQRIGLVALADQRLARLEVDDLAPGHEPAQRLVLDAREQRRLPQAGDDLVDGEVGVGHSCAR